MGSGDSRAVEVCQCRCFLFRIAAAFSAAQLLVRSSDWFDGVSSAFGNDPKASLLMTRKGFNLPFKSLVLRILTSLCLLFCISARLSPVNGSPNWSLQMETGMHNDKG